MRRLRKAQAECIGYGYTETTMWSSPNWRIRHPSAQTAYAEGVLSKKTAAEHGFVEVSMIQQFLKFCFSKGTNAELKLRSTLQHRAVLKVEKLTSRKNRSCQRLHRNRRLRDCRIFWWKTPCSQWKLLMSLKWIWNSTECFFHKKI